MIQIDSITFLALIILSYVLVCAGFDSKIFEKIPKLLFKICYPALILVSFAYLETDLERHHTVFVIVFTALCSFLIYFGAYAILSRYRNEKRKELIAFYMVVGNVTFVGLPFIYLFFGIFGVSFAILFGVVQDIIIWSFSYVRFSGKRDFKQILKAILNPCFIAVVVGFIIAGSPLVLPDAAKLPIQMLSDTTIPLALLYVGSLLAQNKGVLKSVNRGAVFAVCIKTLVLPALAYATMRIVGVDIFLAMLCSFLLSLPAPILLIIFAEEFNKDVAFANAVFVVSVVLFLILCLALLLLQTTGHITLQRNIM